MSVAMMAIISKAVFEADARAAKPGDVLPLDRYNSSNKALAGLGSAGRLFLVTVRPPDERLWLVAVLEQPAQRDGAWVAAPNRVAIADITALRAQIRFANGKGISAQSGALGMSLQTPRQLADDDVRLLDGGAAPAKAAKSPAPRAPAAPPAPPAPPAQPPPPQEMAAAAAQASDLTAAMRDEDHARALGLALARWRKTHAPALAELIERLSARLPKKAPAITTTDLSQASIDDVRRLIEDCAALAADPRVAATYTGMLVQPPFTSLGSRVVWTPLLTQLGDVHADPRTLQKLKPLADDYTRVFGKTKMGEQMQRGVRRLVDKLQKQFPAVADDEEARALLALLPATPTSPAPARAGDDRGAELLAAIYAHPDDDDARLVYADWLLEQNDPRGEFINLQFRRHRGETLTPADEKREAQLLKKHLKEWLGPLHPVTANDRHFARGFLERCTFVPRGAATGQALDHPAWATVRELTISTQGTGDSGEGIVLQPVMRRLRSLRNCNGPLLQALLRHPDCGIEELHIGYFGGPGAHGDEGRKPLWELLLAGQGLLQLRRLCVGEWTYLQPEQYIALLHSPLGGRLEKFVIQSHWAEQKLLPLMLQETATALAIEIHNRDNPPKVQRIGRGADGRYAVLA
jgi:uncharacterized protein (TIGR02996 family)